MNGKAYVGQMWCVRSEARPSEFHPIERQGRVTSTKYGCDARRGPRKRTLPCRHAFPAQRLLINEASSQVGTTIKKRMSEALELRVKGLDSVTVTAAFRDPCSDNRSSAFAHH